MTLTGSGPATRSTRLPVIDAVVMIDILDLDTVPDESPLGD
jgi:hypothetical protein